MHRLHLHLRWYFSMTRVLQAEVFAVQFARQQQRQMLCSRIDHFDGYSLARQPPDRSGRAPGRSSVAGANRLLVRTIVRRVDGTGAHDHAQPVVSHPPPTLLAWPAWMPTTRSECTRSPSAWASAPRSFTTGVGDTPPFRNPCFGSGWASSGRGARWSGGRERRSRAGTGRSMIPCLWVGRLTNHQVT